MPEKEIQFGALLNINRYLICKTWDLISHSAQHQLGLSWSSVHSFGLCTKKDVEKLEMA